MRFLQRSFGLSGFLVFWRFLKNVFLSFTLVWWCTLPIFPSFHKFPFHRAFLFVFYFSLLAWHIFLCKMSSLYRRCIYWLSLLWFAALFRFFFFLQTVWYRTRTIGGRFFSSDLVSLYPPMYFPCMWFSGIRAIKNKNRDSASPKIIFFWVFTPPVHFSPAVGSTLLFCMVF